MKLLVSLLACALLGMASARAGLSFRVGDPEVSQGNAMIKLTATNSSDVKVESARAVAFLMDEKGKVVGQSAQWVIGGSKDRPALEPKKDTSFFFVIPVDNNSSATGTNLTAKVTFLKVILEGGK